MEYVNTTGNAMEQNWQMFVITVYVYAIPDTYKLTGDATKVKHFKFKVISIILCRQKMSSYMYSVNIYNSHWLKLLQFAFLRGNNKYSLFYNKGIFRCYYLKLHKTRIISIKSLKNFD